MAKVSITGNHVAVCSSTGVRIFDIATMEQKFSVDNAGGAADVCFQPSISMAAVVAQGMRRVLLCDLLKNTTLSELYFDTEVLAVHLNPKRLAVTCAEQTHLFDLQTLDPLPQVRTCWPLNEHGVSAMSSLMIDGSCLVAVPQSGDTQDSTRGDVFLVDTISFASVTIVCAHKCRVTQIVFSPDSNCFATCSEKGQNIRLFSVSGARLASFKRGATPATIFGIAMSTDGGVLACTSSSGTMHVFRFEDSPDRDRELKSFSKTDVGPEPSELVMSNDGRCVWVAYPPVVQGRSASSPLRDAPGTPSSSPKRFVAAAGTGKASARVVRYTIEEGKGRLESEAAVDVT
jgi:hypothetical protein